MEELLSLSYKHISGVEVNQTLVDMARKKGLSVDSVSGFDMAEHKEKYDVLVMSHIIEHFQYQDLIQFME